MFRPRKLTAIAPFVTLLSVFGVSCAEDFDPAEVTKHIESEKETGDADGVQDENAPSGHENTESSDDGDASQADSNESGDNADDGSDNDSGIEEQRGPSCREIMDCTADCLRTTDNPITGLMSCISDCNEGADPEESEKAQAFATCIAGNCVANESCSFPVFSSDDCFLCIGAGLTYFPPDECSEEAEECK